MSFRQRGFSMLELVVVLTVILVLTGVLLERIQFYQAEAEQIMARSVATNIRTAMRVRVAQLTSMSNEQAIAALADGNPITLLVAPPPNYGGEVEQSGLRSLKPGNWYYRKRDKVLVYLLNYRNFVAIEGQSTLNFKVELLHQPKPRGSRLGQSYLALVEVPEPGFTVLK